jgi:two-component system NarL family sensor kinase
MRARWWAVLLGTATASAALGAVTTALVLDWSIETMFDAFLLSNVLIGLGFGLCGALIAWHRPQLPLGWLYAVGGVCQTLSALCAPMAELLHTHHAATSLVRLDLTVFQWAWPVNIGIAIPLSLLLLPDGRLASRRWRPVLAVVAVSAPLFVLEVGLSSDEALTGYPPPFLTLSRYQALSWLWSVDDVRLVLSLLVGVGCLVWRYRRGTEQVRRQLLWVLAAAAVVLVVVVFWGLVAGTPAVVLFAIPLIPVSIAVAVLRHNLLDIRLVVARGTAFALLSGIVLAAYVGLVALVSSGVVSAVVVALLALPLRARLQRAVDRLLYGERSDPLLVAARVGPRLPDGLVETLHEVRTVLRLPGVRIEVGGVTVAESGTLHGATAVFPLPDAGLVVALRPGERRLGAADARALQLLVGPLAVAVHATWLSEQLQASRERLVRAREEERRRLRRDLHDGLGPLLTGIALSADAADNLAGRAPVQASALITAVRSDTRTAIGEVRRIVEDLRPPALDELGLLAALQARAAQTGHRADGSCLTALLEAPESLPALPAAVEVAVYRIVTEALTNTVRHSTASRVTIRLTCSGELSVEVRDDGTGRDPWTMGVGIAGMRERVAELGGRCEVGPGQHGGRVWLSLPLAGA